MGPAARLRCGASSLPPMRLHVTTLLSQIGYGGVYKTKHTRTNQKSNSIVRHVMRASILGRLVGIVEQPYGSTNMQRYSEMQYSISLRL
eukprot:487158-Amphidinium_carterae.1